MSTLRFSANAENDLLDAWLYVAEGSIDAADHLLEQIEADARKLLRYPHMGRLRDELAEGLRCWPGSTPYLIFYFELAGDITVARVLHHARDITALAGWPTH